MKITAIPLDKRPYNYQFLKDIANFDKEVELVIPKKDRLGEKKNSADIDYLQEFLWGNSSTDDAVIISLDMLIYGGLFPARIHDLNEKKLMERLNFLKRLKNKNKTLKIYASSLILRTPQYNSKEEEPFYYGEHGMDIFLWGYYNDKKSRRFLSLEEEKDFLRINKTLPKEYLEDFINRREKNRKITIEAINLCKEGVIDLLIIPQDDASEFGHTAIDQNIIYQHISENRLQGKVYLHPGTDESGCTLLTRAYLDKKGIFKMYPLYSAETFKNIVPIFEDRPFQFSLLSHSLACGITLVEKLDEASACLAISGAPIVMQEAFEVTFGIDVHGNKKYPTGRGMKDISYYRCRNLRDFTKKIEDIIDMNILVGVADVATSNGGEKELLDIFDECEVLERISAYAGWNTTCNTLGTVLAALVFATLGNNKEAIEYFKISRIINDWAYQTETRFDIQLNYLRDFGDTYSNFNNKDDEILELIRIKTTEKLRELLKKSYNNKNIIIEKVEAPFKRLSGLEFKITI
ncbi:DUF4127 family protein [Cetobacterium sp.]|uniref:DUF4127 family protein n=1 Tax=Cetobacterium sp. TaxID=2071632 RepID=UPI003EE72F49